LQQSEARARDLKLEETLRNCRELKARFDRIEARRGGDYHAYNSFEGISRKLGEFDRSIKELAKPKDELRTRLLSSMFFVTAAILGLRLLPLGG
jgi:hypothetical protein